MEVKSLSDKIILSKGKATCSCPTNYDCHAYHYSGLGSIYQENDLPSKILVNYWPLSGEVFIRQGRDFIGKGYKLVFDSGWFLQKRTKLGLWKSLWKKEEFPDLVHSDRPSLKLPLEDFPDNVSLSFDEYEYDSQTNSYVFNGSYSGSLARISLTDTYPKWEGNGNFNGSVLDCNKVTLEWSILGDWLLAWLDANDDVLFDTVKSGQKSTILGDYDDNDFSIYQIQNIVIDNS